MAALASAVISLRKRSYSLCPDEMWSLVTTPEMPSMSTEMRTFMDAPFEKPAKIAPDTA